LRSAAVKAVGASMSLFIPRQSKGHRAATPAARKLENVARQEVF
jgi:hypothetical protein